MWAKSMLGETASNRFKLVQYRHRIRFISVCTCISSWKFQHLAILQDNFSNWLISRNPIKVVLKWRFWTTIKITACMCVKLDELMMTTTSFVLNDQTATFNRVSTKVSFIQENIFHGLISKNCVLNLFVQTEFIKWFSRFSGPIRLHFISGLKKHL